MDYHIYLQDVCIGDVNNVRDEDSALTVYALRTGSDIQGLTAVPLTPLQMMQRHKPVFDAILSVREKYFSLHPTRDAILAALSVK